MVKEILSLVQINLGLMLGRGSVRGSYIVHKFFLYHEFSLILLFTSVTTTVENPGTPLYKDIVSTS